MANYSVFVGGVPYTPFNCTTDYLPLCVGEDTDNIDNSKLLDTDMCKILTKLSENYDKKPTDLVVGDVLSIFAMPTWSQLTSLGVDVVSNEAGFTFDLVASTTQPLIGERWLSQYSPGTPCQSTHTHLPGAPTTGIGATNDDYMWLFTGVPSVFFPVAGTIDMVITSIPVGGLKGDANIRFWRGINRTKLCTNDRPGCEVQNTPLFLAP